MTVKGISPVVAGIVCGVVLMGCAGKSEKQVATPVEEAVYAVNTKLLRKLIRQNRV